MYLSGKGKFLNGDQQVTITTEAYKIHYRNKGLEPCLPADQAGRFTK